MKHRRPGGGRKHLRSVVRSQSSLQSRRLRHGREGVGGRTWAAKHGEITSWAVSCSLKLHRVLQLGDITASSYNLDVGAREQRVFSTVEAHRLQAVR